MVPASCCLAQFVLLDAAKGMAMTCIDLLAGGAVEARRVRAAYTPNFNRDDYVAAFTAWHTRAPTRTSHQLRSCRTLTVPDRDEGDRRRSFVARRNSEVRHSKLSFWPLRHNRIGDIRGRSPRADRVGEPPGFPRINRRFRGGAPVVVGERRQRGEPPPIKDESMAAQSIIPVQAQADRHQFARLGASRRPRRAQSRARGARL